MTMRMIGVMARRISSPVIVGRDTELEQLRAAVARGTARDTPTILISGEAGVGKSRLVAELAASRAELGAQAVVGGCPAVVDTPLPYAPIVAVIEAMLRETTDEDVAPLLDGIGDDLVRLVPGITSRLADARPVNVPDAMIPGRVFDAVRRLFQRTARDRPLVVVFEDLHWADPASLDLIGYLVRNGGWPGAIIVTYRSDELHRRHPLLPWIAEILRIPTVERIELDRLPPLAIAAQVAAILGAAPGSALTDELVRRGGGNAFLTEELLASRAADGHIPRTTGVTQVLLARVDAIPDGARPVVDALSVSGAPADTLTLAAVLDTPEREVEAALRAALEAQVLAAADDGASYGFRHALLQEAVYDDLLPGERRRYHLGFVGALQAGIERLGTDQPPSAARLAQVVHHALAADDLVTALRASVAAGTAAMAAGAFVDASKHLERAVQLSETVPDPATIVSGGRPELLRLAAEAASFSTDPARAVRLWQEAIDAAGPDAPPEDRARLLLGLAVCANDIFDNELAVRSTRAADALLADQPPSFLRAKARADLARDLYVVGEITAGNATAQEAIALAAEVGDLRTEALALGRLALSRIQVGEVEQAKADAIRAMEIARMTRDRFVVPSVYFNCGYTFDTLGDPATAGEILVDEGIPLATELGLPTLAFAAHAAWYLWQAGRWDQGQRALDAAAGEEGTRSGRSLAIALSQALYDAVRLPEVSAAALEPSDPTDPAPFMIAAERALWHGQPAAAAEYAMRGLDAAVDAVARRDRSNRGWLLRQLARSQADLATAHGRGRSDEAPTVAAWALDRTRALIVEGEVADVHGDDLEMNVVLTEAEAGRAAGDSDPHAWTAAIELWEGRGRRFEPAYARYRRAEALLEAGGHRAAATEDLRLAQRTAVELEAAPLRRLIEALAARARIPLGEPTPPDGAGDDGEAALRLPSPLTRREREVLVLLAEGRSNRQIANTLFISESTAGVHVSNILGKLGVSGRTEAAAVAFRAGLVPSNGDAGA
jgi:DNA-binding CsgD family transcriptional regulator